MSGPEEAIWWEQQERIEELEAELAECGIAVVRLGDKEYECSAELAGAIDAALEQARAESYILGKESGFEDGKREGYTIGKESGTAEERERCARTAMATFNPKQPEDADYDWGYNDAKRDIAHAIRQGTEAELAERDQCAAGLEKCREGLAAAEERQSRLEGALHQLLIAVGKHLKEQGYFGAFDEDLLQALGG